MKSVHSVVTSFIVVFLGLAAGCAPPARHAEAPATSTAAAADSCVAMGSILRREAMLLQEHGTRLMSADISLAGAVSGLHGIERAFNDVASDLKSARFENAENAQDATVAATELGQATTGLAKARDRVELLVRTAATPLREAREKSWEMRTVCEGSKRPNADCRLLMKTVSDGELSSWTNKDAVEQASAKLAKLTIKDATMARDVGGVQTKLKAAATAMGDLDKLDLEGALKRSSSHGEVATKALIRIRERCGEAKTLTSVDWVAAPAGTDPRKLTVLVLGVLPDSMRKIFDADGRKGADLSSGSSGSGVVVVREVRGKRRVLVVTNRHVVEHALRTKIAIDGVKDLHDARVAYIDPHHDLAVLEVAADPSGALPFSAGVTIETQAAADQQTVVAAGYPGMGDHPSYQVTKGYVSNKQVHLDGDAAPYLQHTAPIDPGSSGGPLLSDRGRLLGINTLKILDREGVGLAIPADVVADAVRAAESPVAVEAQDARLTCLATLADLATSRPADNAARHLSASFVADVGPSSWSRIVKSLTPDMQQQATTDFRRDALGVLYWASAARLQQSLKASGGVSELEMCEGVTLTANEGAPTPSSATANASANANKNEDGSLARFIIQTVKGPRELKLVRERGRWTVASFDFRDSATDQEKTPKPNQGKKVPTKRTTR